MTSPQSRVFATWALYVLVGYEQLTLPRDPTLFGSGSPPTCSTSWKPDDSPASRPLRFVQRLRSSNADAGGSLAPRGRSNTSPRSRVRRTPPCCAGGGRHPDHRGRELPDRRRITDDDVRHLGSVALLIVVDFPGNRNARALAYTSLGCVGLLLISLGTLVASQPWLAILLMFGIGVVVSFGPSASRSPRPSARP